MKRRRTDLRLEECFLYAISSPKDLARRLSIKARPVDAADLKDLAADIGNYKLFKIAGRPIQQPKARLQAIHLRVHRLLSKVAVPEYLHSAVKGRSYLSNAFVHKGNEATIKIDIKKFFASVPDRAVLRFLRKPCRCRSDVAKLLTEILTFNGILATGSSASPILAYYAFKPMFDEIAMLAAELDLKFTVYVDDMTLSGLAATRSTMTRIRAIIAKHGLKSHKARKFAANGQRIVTGVCISSDGFKVPNRLLHRIANDFDALHQGETGQQRKRRIGSLLGRLEAAGRIDASYRARAATLRARASKEANRPRHA